MTRRSHTRSPNYVHPEKASAVGSRNSLYRDGRNEYAEAKVIIDEEVDKILNHISSKLPPEVAEKLHVGGTVKEVLHNYFNQGFQNMYNRYLVSVEDEMAKKLRDLIDKQETENLNQYTPKNVKDLLDSLGGQENFTNYSLETSIANIYGNLQGHIQKAIVALDNQTKKLLREKSDIGYFLDGNQASTILKCNISNNPNKPETVYDVNLVLNIIESELREIIYHYQIASEVIIKNVLSEHILKLVEEEVEQINAALVDSRQKELSKNSRVFEKIKGLEDHFGFASQADESPAYGHMAKRFVDAIQGIEAEIDLVDFDPLNIRENVETIIDDADIRNMGYNAAVTTLISILDMSHLGYQYIENFKNCRKTIIREYSEIKTNDLPDENYTLSLCHQDDMQLREDRTAHCQQLEEFAVETEKLFKVFHKLREVEKKRQGFLDYKDIAEEYLKTNKKRGNNGSSLEGNGKKKLWDEISFIQPEKGDIEKLNETFVFQSQALRKKFSLLRQRINDLWEWEFPPERVILEQRIDFIESNFQKFSQKYNPFQAHPGLFMEVTLSSVKRREITLSAMSNAITRFVASISHGFLDGAYEEFHQKKKLELAANDQTFGSAS